MEKKTSRIRLGGIAGASLRADCTVCRLEKLDELDELNELDGLDG